MKIKNKKISLFSIILLLVTFFPVKVVFAALQMNYKLLEAFPGFYTQGQAAPDLPAFILSLYKFGIWTVGIAGMFMIVIGGIMYMTSAGNTSTAGSAKGIITDALIGIVTALVAYLFLYVINPDLVKLNLNFVPVEITDVGPGPSTSGSGNCKAITDPSNPCSIDQLKTFVKSKGYNDTQATDWAQKASSICNAESGGNTNAASGGKCGGTSIAWGLFQVNLNAWCTGAFTAKWDRSSGFTNGGCAVADQTIFEKCRQNAVNPTWNINKMWTLYKASGWKPWEVTLNGMCPNW